MTNTPFTYRVIHKPSGKWYYGVKYSKGCSPKDLWNTYFTSSSIIKRMIKDDGIHSFEIEIRKIFSNVDSARNWEIKVLRKIINWDCCLNESAFPAVSLDICKKTHKTKLVIQENGLNIYQQASMTWKNKKYLIEPESGLTYEKLRVNKLNITLDKNNTRNIPKPMLRGDNNPSKRPEVSSKISESLKEGYNSGRLVSAFKNKTHSDKTKLLQSEIKKGNKNPCYNTFFINDGTSNRRIPTSSNIPEGWVKGRLLRNEHKFNAKKSSNFNKEFFSLIETKKSYNKGNAVKCFPELKQYF